MRTFFIFAASALLLAAVTVELSTRLWPDSSLALLVIAALALLAQGYLSLRFAPAGAADAAAQAKQAGRREPRQKDARQKDSGRKQSAARQQRDSAPVKADSGRQQRDTQPARQEKTADSTAAEPPSGGPRENGTVKWFNRSKGFGFIIRESGEEIFVHQRSILAEGTGENRRRPALKDGQAVTFVVADREKGLQAEEVSPA